MRLATFLLVATVVTVFAFFVWAVGPAIDAVQERTTLIECQMNGTCEP